MAAEPGLLDLARRGDEAAFERLVERHRGELYAHCYRMLGSVQDAEDALQESLLDAWRGMAGFQGRSSLRAWLYRVTTNACLRLISRRPGGDPAASYLRRESVELAFVAALQHLPGTQRAVLILREVLQFSAAEVAGILDTTPASVHSALQRARKAVDQRVPPTTQQAELDALGADGRRELVDAFVAAWERADVAAILELLADDARFTMPPLPAWFLGREDVGRFFSERMFATPWRLLPVGANRQLAFACYHGDPGVHRHFGLPGAPPGR